MNEFAEELHDVFERFGPISLRRMFGGHGVFHEGRMFGLISGGRLYLKADAQTVAFFEARQLPPFEYQRRGQTARISYYEAPPELFEDRHEAELWAERAWEAVLRAGAPKPAARRAPSKRIRGST
ncbi:TfoX/Sxy family protein [Variovorax sp. J22P271]|uniref:TfoX/Sxy family protein n=1 Tax=Variovorax davisae TaxID=3053515 RepID=UPI002578E407|nr:TfoX/Sxy family protein [Variovorax sp. J22P271]MDM0033228.1 TfoX/Sxy family protein [Variovorax sp. J22P271]